MPQTIHEPAATSKRALRVLVTGSRRWTEGAEIWAALNVLGQRAVLSVVHGACPAGADYYAHRWVLESIDNRHTEEPYPADWSRYGKRAGFLRNSAMVRAGADLCLAFIRNDSNGATHCATEAEKAGIPTVVFRQTYPDLSQVADALAMVTA